MSIAHALHLDGMRDRVDGVGDRILRIFHIKTAPHINLKSAVFLGEMPLTEKNLKWFRNDPTFPKMVAEAMDTAIAWGRSEEAAMLAPHIAPEHTVSLFRMAIDRMWDDTKTPEKQAARFAVLKTLSSIVKQGDKDDQLRFNAMGVTAHRDMLLPQLRRVPFLIAMGANMNEPTIPENIVAHLDNIGAFAGRSSYGASGLLSVRDFSLILRKENRPELDQAINAGYALGRSIESSYGQIANILPPWARLQPETSRPL